MFQNLSANLMFELEHMIFVFLYREREHYLKMLKTLIEKFPFFLFELWIHPVGFIGIVIKIPRDIARFTTL